MGKSAVCKYELDCSDQSQRIIHKSRGEVSLVEQDIIDYTGVPG